MAYLFQIKLGEIPDIFQKEEKILNNSIVESGEEFCSFPSSMLFEQHSSAFYESSYRSVLFSLLSFGIYQAFLTLFSE